MSESLIKMVFRKFVALVLTALLLFGTTSVYATSSNSKPDTQNKKLDFGALGPSASSGKAKRMVENTYSQITYESLFKLAWSFDAYSVSDDDALNAYLVVTECNLYNKFFQNEFEWEKIKIATRKFILENKDKAPRYYEYVQPIFMGRYDYSLQGFPIVEDAEEFKGQKNFQFANFRAGETSCGSVSISSSKFPGTGVLNISSPLNLSFIRVPLPLAEKYIEWRTNQKNIDDTKRQAYIRYRIRIDAYDGIKGFSGGLEAFNFRGKLMRLDVFADKELLLPLYNQVF